MSLTILDGLAFAVVLLMVVAMAESASEKSRKRSVSHKGSPNHTEYLKTLRLPSSSTIQHIASIQRHNEAAIDAKYHTAGDDEVQAATTIQQAYRGFRDRRQLKGKTLDPSARWADAIKELRYREATSHQRRSLGERRPSTPEQRARANWKLAGEIASHAAGEDCSPPPPLNDAATGLSSEDGRHTTDTMFLDLRYFLEMVDKKHRYGTNLQVYHEEWQRSITKENFFSWLDHGEGRKLSLRGCSREKLDRERIRYLSREERRDYEVMVDETGKLRWLKTGDLITTSSEYQDSAHGIIAKGSPGAIPPTSDPDEASSSSAYDSDTPSESTTDLNPVPPEKRQGKRTKARRHLRVSPATILNHLLRASVKPGTWIYVSDAVGRLYVGIKTSGAFQHASFLAGARISSAGLIGIQNGQLVYLSPLSGHYRPTPQSFMAFIDNLKRKGVDTNELRVSGAYGLLVGMERYGRMKKGLGKVAHPHRRKDSGRRQSGVQIQEIDAISTIERHWDEEHTRPRGISRLVSDLHIRRRSSAGQDTSGR